VVVAVESEVGGAFAVVGGHVEVGESPLAALWRELREELGAAAFPEPEPGPEVGYRETSGRTGLETEYTAHLFRMA